MIYKFYKGVTELGIIESMPSFQQRALRIFNIFSLLAIPLPVLANILISGGTFHFTPFVVSAIMSCAFILTILFNYFGYFIISKTLYYSLSCAIVLIHVYYFGGSLHIEFAFVAIFISVFALSYNAREIIVFSALSILFYLLCIIIDYQVVPIKLYEGGAFGEIGFGLLIFGVSFLLLWSIRSQNEKHELTIEEKNQQLVDKNEEIEAQHDEIVKTSRQLESKNTSITASISYAQRIQQAILPSDQEVKANLPDSFIYYKPRDVVSGDFYWHLHFYSKTYFAVADCTGHGVPGAFMSMLGSSLLNLIVQSTFADSPRLILKYLDLQLTQMLSRGRDDSREGMEITLIVADKSTGTLKVSSTNRPFYRFRNGSLDEFKGNRTFIGKSMTEKRPFEEQIFETKPGDTFYFFTDGITDQFDATNRKKYTAARLRHFLTDINVLPIEQQGQWIDREMEVWKGTTPQTDDMLLAGIKF